MSEGKKAVTIRAAFVKQGGGVELRELARPELDEGSIIVKMKASGVCGTDLEKLTGRGITSPILGHEVSGIVTESASDLFHEGDFVIPHHHVACGKCDLCAAGAETMCQGFKTSNFVPGGFAEEFKVPAYNVEHGGVHLVRGDISFEEASFAEPLGCCIRALNHLIGRKGSKWSALKNVLVVGVGPIGLLHMELLRNGLSNLNLVAVDINKTRLKFAESYEGATPIDVTQSKDGAFSFDALKSTNSLGFDLVIVATGSASAFAEALRCVRKSGSVLLFGAPHKGAVHQLDLASFFLNELTITSSYSTTEVEIRSAISLLESRSINVKKFVTSTYHLADIEEAMNVARSENQIKVIVTE